MRMKIKYFIKNFITVLILWTMIIGCKSFFSMPSDNNSSSKSITIYDRQGNVQQNVIVKDDHIMIYDKNWNVKGYGKSQNK